MNDFITGILVEIEIGAAYQGHVWDYWLRIRLNDGREIQVFDSACLSEGFTEGETYQFILHPFLLTPPDSPDDSIDGEIVRLYWRPDLTGFKTIDFSPSRYVPLETKYGCWPLFPDEIAACTGKNPQTGQKFSWRCAWKHDRIDLYGIARLPR